MSKGDKTMTTMRGRLKTANDRAIYDQLLGDFGSLTANKFVRAVMYRRGDTKPHYPVPAILYDPLLDVTSFEYWMFHGYLQAKGYRTKPCQT